MNVDDAESLAKPRRHQILPGFGLTMGYTITYLVCSC